VEEENMKKSRHLLWAAAVAILGVLAVSAAGFRSAYGQAEQPKDRTSRGDVVIMRCSVVASELPVTAYQGSPAAPAKKSTNCAENLSSLMKEGFAIRDVGHYDDEKLGIVVFTMLR
jgi:hypothetical protein